MRWTTASVLFAALITLQSVVAPAIEVMGMRPDALLVVVVFLALSAPKYDALLAAWIVGTCADLMTVERMGLLGLSYALAALMVLSVRDYVFRERALTQFVLTLWVGMIIRAIWLVYARTMYAASLPWGSALLTSCLGASLYTAAWVLLVHRPLVAASAWLGLHAGRYAAFGMRIRERSRV